MYGEFDVGNSKEWRVDKGGMVQKSSLIIQTKVGIYRSGEGRTMWDTAWDESWITRGE